MSDTCAICLEDYKGRVKRLTCQYCPADACRGCHQRYLLQSYEDPHCMTCKRGWSSDFMALNFPMTFRNKELRLHRRKVLFEREKTVLPALQVYVEYKKDARRLTQERDALYAEVGHEHSQAETNKTTLAFRWRRAYEENLKLTRIIYMKRADIRTLKFNMTDAGEEIPPQGAAIDGTVRTGNADLIILARLARDQAKAHKTKLLAELEVLGPAYLEKRDKLHTIQRDLFTAQANYDDRDGSTKERREFIMRCPVEDCRGFLSTAYKCGTCETWACKDCLVPIGKDSSAAHTCNPDTVESAKAIRDETRPCPKCGTRIFKIDGCDQMWCVMDGCGTAFSWNSGHIVTGVVHNPHYYEWLRRNGAAAPGREVGDIPCGGMPTPWQFVHAIGDTEIPNEMKMTLLESFRNMQELVAERIRSFPARMPQLMNKEIDVDYLMNVLSEDEWKRKLEMSEARFNRNKEIGQILQTLITAGSDMMNRLYEKVQEIDSDLDTELFVNWLLDIGIPELEQLRSFGNESLKVLAKRDKMAVPQFEDNWKWKGARALYKKPKAIAKTTTETEIVTTV